MVKEEYQKLIDMTLNLRVAESMLCEATDILKQANKTLKELVLKKEEKDAVV